MRFLSIFFCAFFAIQASNAQAHTLWVNCFESHTHKPGHAIVSLGWGHTQPMDDILNSPSGGVTVSTFILADPSGEVTPLFIPSLEQSKPFVSNRNYDVFPGDIGAQKVALKEGSASGVYQIGASSRPAFYTKYIDSKGRQRMKMKPKNELKNVDKVLMSVNYEAFSKSFFVVGEWVDPKPLGHGLEIIPKTDLSNLRAGDMVEVEVLHYGKPLHSSAKSPEYIVASSSSFGQGEGFSLFSSLEHGKAQFRVQQSGQWCVAVKHKEDVAANSSLKSLQGKADQVYHSATMTFSVK